MLTPHCDDKIPTLAKRQLDSEIRYLILILLYQPWDFFGRNDANSETPVLWPPHAKS